MLYLKKKKKKNGLKTCVVVFRVHGGDWLYSRDLLRIWRCILADRRVHCGSRFQLTSFLQQHKVKRIYQSWFLLTYLGFSLRCSGEMVDMVDKDPVYRTSFEINSYFSLFLRKIEGDEIQTTASLVFRKISEDDLSKNYTCKLAAVYQSSDFVTIHLRNGK